MQANNSQEVCYEQKSMEGPLPSQELMDFIQCVIAPLLVDRFLEGEKKDAGQSYGRIHTSRVKLEVGDSQEPE